MLNEGKRQGPRGFFDIKMVGKNLVAGFGWPKDGGGG